MTDKPKAVVLLSGGLDSATTAALAQNRGFLVHAISFRYGQRHQAELAAAAKVAASLGLAGRVVVDIGLGAFSGSALTDQIEVPKDRPESEMAAGVPVTYVPARNTVFLALALARAESLAAPDIFIGVNAVDYSGYPDCRPEFIAAFEKTANLATALATEQGRKITIHAPLIKLSKAEIIKTGLALGVDYSLTTSCYDPDAAGRACGHCDACQLRLKGFAEAGLSDPAAYQ